MQSLDSGSPGTIWHVNILMNKFAVVMVTAAGLGSFAVVPSASAQTTSQAPLREVRGQTIISNEFPKADLTVGKDFHYVGGQRVNLYGNADAEQHILVKVGNDGVVERFYWLQFEHFVPTNTYTYDYHLSGTTDIGGLSFVYDVKSWPNYAKNNAEDPGSDGEAITRLLADHNLAFPKRAARVRMFHLPTQDHRTELMIIYGEALPEGSQIPVREGGVVLDKEAPAAARAFLESARRDLTIRMK